MKKNDEFVIQIEDMGADGAGIGRHEGMTFFVKDALIGDVARVGVTKLKSTHGYARLIEVVEPSPDRVDPPCPYARPCGGCQISELSYEAQLVYKQRRVEEALRRIGGFPDLPVEPIRGMEDPLHYRNRALYPVGTDREGRPVVGFYAGRSHRIVECRDCALGDEENREILDIILDYMARCDVPAYDETSGEGLVRHIQIRSAFATGERMVCLVVNGESLPREKELIASLAAVPGMASIGLNINRRPGNVILGDTTRTLWGQPTITDEIRDLRFALSPTSFYQVNPRQTRVIYELARECAALSGSETVWDLYCGIGTISLFLAQEAARVYGVESVSQAVADACANAKTNGMDNAVFFAGDAAEIFARRAPETGADVVVVDPPRKGCAGELLAAIGQAAPARVVYVSCDPATLARDMSRLCAGGMYRPVRVCPVDNFPQTVHVETVALLQRA